MSSFFQKNVKKSNESAEKKDKKDYQSFAREGKR